MSVTTSTQADVLALREAVYKALYQIDKLASGAQMPGAAVADNTEYAAEIDELIGNVTTAAAAVSAAGDTVLLTDGDTVDVDGTDYTVSIEDGVSTFTAA